MLIPTIRLGIPPQIRTTQPETPVLEAKIHSSSPPPLVGASDGCRLLHGGSGAHFARSAKSRRAAAMSDNPRRGPRGDRGEAGGIHRSRLGGIHRSRRCPKKEAGDLSAPRSRLLQLRLVPLTPRWNREGSSSEPSRRPSRSRCRRSRRSTHQRWPSRRSTSRRPR